MGDTVQAPTKSSLLRPLALPLAFIVALAGLCVLPQIRDEAGVLRAFLLAAGALLAWTVVLAVVTLSKGRALSFQVVLSKQHYIQACIQISIYLIWGWYWRQVYAEAPLILGQLLFSYAFGLLLAWSRGQGYALGFGPLPIVFSINIFIWFRSDWYYLQFLAVALGFVGKELIHWQKEGRSVHIFNPSTFALCVVSLALIFTGTSDSLTWGRQIALSQFFPPHMYLFLFLVSLPVEYLFGVTSMTLAAVATTYVFGLAFFAVTGTYFFYDSYIPIAVFLSMHLLITDPSTAPRSELGRLIFGSLFGLTVVLAFQILDSLDLPSAPDKLLSVPFLNFSIQYIDRIAARLSRSKLFGWLDPARLAPSLQGRPRNLAYMAVWAALFAFMSSVQAVGDDHPGQFVPFWLQRCQAHNARACDWLNRQENAYCAARSGWACNEAGAHALETQHDHAAAANLVEGGCALGYMPACGNVLKLRAGGETLEHAPPTVADYPVILSGSKGARLAGLSPGELSALACAQGWTEACQAR